MKQKARLRLVASDFISGETEIAWDWAQGILGRLGTGTVLTVVRSQLAPRKNKKGELVIHVELDL